MKKNNIGIFIVLAAVLLAVTSALGMSIVQYSGKLVETAGEGYVLTKQEVFNDAGELAKEGSVKQNFFEEGTKLKPVYPEKVEFKTTESEKVTVDNSSFMYYTDGSLSSFKDSVILNMQDAKDGSPTYYDVSYGR